MSRGSGRSGAPGSYDQGVPRVLIAEDDEGIRGPLVRALQREGYDVDAVADGDEAARLGVEDHHDLLVLDIGLPGLDGLEVCRRVRDARPDVAVLFLTAQAGELDAVAGPRRRAATTTSPSPSAWPSCWPACARSCAASRPPRCGPPTSASTSARAGLAGRPPSSS